MKRFCTILLLLFSIHLVNAQTFNKTFAIDSGEIEEAVGLVIEDRYYFFGIGRTNGANPSNLGAELFVTDSSGNLLSASQNKQMGLNFSAGRENSFIKRGVNELLRICTDFNTSGTNNIYKATLTSYDTLLNIHWQKQYLGNNSFFRSMRITPEGDILVLGEKGGNGNVDLILMKLDSLGNTIWWKQYGGIVDDTAYTLDILEDGNYLIGARHVYDVFPNMDGWLMKTDTAGNVIWDKYIESPGADFGAHVFDKKYFFQAKDTVYKLPGGAFSDAISYFSEIDDFGNVLWTEEIELIPDQIIKDAIKLNDGGYLIVQSYIDYAYGGNVSWLIKYDEERNKIWERYYFLDNARSNGLVDVKEDADGNFVFIGTVLTTDTLLNSDIWALKLNSDGCLDATDCGEPIGILDLTIAKEVFGIQVNPNPVKTQAKIIIKNSANFLGEVLQINIYNAEGKQVHSQTKKLRGQLPAIDLNVSNYIKGIYYIKASVNGKEYGNGKFVKQ